MILNHQQLSFLGDSTLPPEILELDTPFWFFSFLFSNEIFEMIKNETNLYAIQKNPNATFNATTLHVRQFVGIVYYMSVIHLPKVRNYWSRSIGVPIIQETMPLNMNNYGSYFISMITPETFLHPTLIVIDF